ncbi:scarecrow-like protein 15 [Cornus florida]|uniref:scarecrow-like protein 15 n=1 Tax=Cornus florida TaxID=4283 RepID=UPI00289B013A|nr:scarecrow-like protein 15 [Cornus florida]
MKVPFTTPKNHQASHPKPLYRNNTVRSTTAPYEPKSVLDLRRSPSPVADKPAGNSDFPVLSDALLQSDDPTLIWVDHLLNNSEDWNSLVRELGLHDDSTVPLLTHSDSQFPILPEFPIPPSDFAFSDTYSNPSLSLNSNSVVPNNNINIEFDIVDELIRVADCFESNELQLAQVILARLNQQLQSPIGKPLLRAAFYFKEALQSLLTQSNRPTRFRSSSEIVQTIKAYKTFSNISPIVMISNFTANQAILEAVDGSRLIHVIDFEIGLGGHWASFMKEIADRTDSQKPNPRILRITAVVSEEYENESRLIRENLSQFARELKIGFEIDFLLIRTFEFLSFKSIKFMAGEKTAVLLSPSIFRHIGAGFLTDLRRISPNVVVYVDGEGCIDGGTSLFRGRVINGLEFYSTVLESLEAASGGCGDWIRGIERFLLRPKIFEVVEAAGRRAPPWREAFGGSGMKAVALSLFADFQAECLLRKVQVKGFHVVKRQAEMVLCWHDRAMVATSAWKC